MTLKQLVQALADADIHVSMVQALADAGIHFSIDGKDCNEVYIDDSLILYGDDAFVTPVEDSQYFRTSACRRTPLKNLKLEDIQPMIRYYRKFHPIEA